MLVLAGHDGKGGVGTTNDNTSPCTSSVYLYSAHPAAVFTAIDPLWNARRVLKPLRVRAKANGAGHRRKKRRKEKGGKNVVSHLRLSRARRTKGRAGRPSFRIEKF